jgi:hypothetical protein
LGGILMETVLRMAVSGIDVTVSAASAEHAERCWGDVSQSPLCRLGQVALQGRF